MNNGSHKRIITAALLIIAMLLVLLLSACDFSDFTQMLSDAVGSTNSSDLTETDDPEADQTEKSSFFIDIKPGQTIESNEETQNDTVPDDEGSLDDISDEALIECVSTNLANCADEIDLTPCLDGYLIDENRID